MTAGPQRRRRGDCLGPVASRVPPDHAFNLRPMIVLDHLLGYIVTYLLLPY
jgi:hypothetical protein